MAKTVAESYERLEYLLKNVSKEKLINILGNWFNSSEFEEFNTFIEHELEIENEADT